MKKILIIALILLSKVVSAQNNLFVGNPWTNANIESIRNYVISFAGDAYKTVNMQTQVSKSIDKAFYLFSDTSGKKLNIDIKRGFINGNPERNIPADTIIKEVKITGYYPVMLKMYKQSFNPDANGDQITKKGKAETIIRPVANKKISVAFFRSGDEVGYWTVWIKLL